MGAGPGPEFGRLLRNWRIAAALSQEVLAERAGISAAAVAALERGRRTRPRAFTVRALADALGLDLTARQMLAAGAAGGRWAPDYPGPPRLPQPLTSFVGRDQDLAEVSALMGRRKIVSLVGSAGCGKTRLALELARRFVKQDLASVWFVDLSVIDDGSRIPETVARSLGIGGSAEVTERTLVWWLADRTALIVLDNCEHVAASAAAVAELLVRECPGIRILATSRERLRSESEWVFRVAPLPIPSKSRPALADLRHVESVRLFEDRARQADSSFELSERNAGGVAQICTRLDGIPLAIELAAACAGSMSLPLILDRLEDRLNLLQLGRLTAPPRQRTLRAAVEWSHDLLSDGERRLFRRLSVFIGSFSIEAVESIVTDAELPVDTVLPLLTGLVERSLVVFSPDEPRGRYRLLETLRAFALEQLGINEGTERLREKHAAYFVEIVGRWFDRWWASQPFEDPDIRDVENLLAALEHSSLLDSSRLGDAAGISHWLRWQGMLDGETAYRWLETLAARTPPDTAALVSIHYGLGKTASRRGHFEVSQRHFEVLLNTCEKANDSHGVARALLELSTLSGARGDSPAALRICHRAVSLARELGGPELLAYALNYYAMTLLRAGESESAVPVAEEALTQARLGGEPHLIGNVLDTVALAYLHNGDAGTALKVQREALQSERRSRWETAAWVYTMAAVLGAAKEPERSLRVAGAADAWFAEQGNQRDPVLAIYQPWIDAAAAALGGRATAIRASGRLMSIEEARTFALEDSVAAS